MEDSYIKEERITVIPSNQDLTITAQSVKKDVPKYWEKEYIHEHMRDISNPKHRMLMQFLWMSGVRITEAVNLRKGDIDFQNYVMRVKWLKSRKYKERNVPIHPMLRNMLEVYTGAMKADQRLFDITRERAWQLTRKYFNGHPHQFRHSFAVNWLRSGADIVTLHRILGHKKFETTQQYLMIVPLDQGKELVKVSF